MLPTIPDIKLRPPPTEEQRWRARTRISVGNYQIKKMSEPPDTRRGKDRGEKRTSAARFVSYQSTDGEPW
jgi:hypothetical protein